MASVMILAPKNAAQILLPIISAISTIVVAREIAVRTAAVNLKSRMNYGAYQEGVAATQ
jgi:hypothetical protein